MIDPILRGFLEVQYAEGMGLARESDILDLFPLSPSPALPQQHYVARFHCTGLVRSPQGEIVPGNLFEVGIMFPDDYLRHADSFETLTWLRPMEVHHPNIAGPAICIGPLSPGTGLVELIYRVFEVITLNRVTMDERNALNHAACQWARQNTDRFPVDRRPLKRRRLVVHVSPSSGDAP